MKTIFSLLLSVLVLTANAQKPAEVDPIVGKWRWRGTKVCFISADQTVMTEDKHRARWEYLKNKEVERKYRFVWDNGAFEDIVILSREGKSLSGKRSDGDKYSATKLDAEVAFTADK
jgi:hypothetical protein